LAMATNEVKLLGIRASPFVNRVQFALSLKSVDYEFIQERFFPKSDLLLKFNPIYKKVPVFFHAEKPICESLVILNYIDDVWNTNRPSILPSDPYDVAIARFWAAYIDDKWYNALGEALIFGQGEEAKVAARQRTFEAMAVIEVAYWECSKGKPYFGGEKIGYLDLVLGCFLGWIKLAEKVVVGFNLLSETQTPGLVGWAERFCSNDTVKSIIQEPENLMDTYNMLKAISSASTN